MEKFPEQIDDPRFSYTQILREGKFAIYRQTHKDSGVSRFETIVIRDHPEHTWPSWDTTPEGESYPSARTWGKYGWSFYSLEEARNKLRDLQYERGRDNDRSE